MRQFTYSVSANRVDHVEILPQDHVLLPSALLYRLANAISRITRADVSQTASKEARMAVVAYWRKRRRRHRCASQSGKTAKITGRCGPRDALELAGNYMK